MWRIKSATNFLAVVLSMLIITGANAQTSTLNNAKTESLQQIILQLKQQPVDNTSKTIIKEKLDLIKKGLQIDPNNSELLYQKALIFTDIERYQLALNIIDELLQQDSTNAKYLKLQGVLKNQLAKTKQTNVQLTDALKQNPQNLQTRLKLIENEIVSHNYKKALAVTKKGLQLHPNNEDLLYQQTLIYIDMEQYQQANKSLAKLSKTKSGMAKAQPLTAMVKSGAQKEAIQKSKQTTKTTSIEPVPVKKTEPPLIIIRPGGISGIAITGSEKNFISFEGYPTKVIDSKPNVNIPEQNWYYNHLTYGRKTNFATYMVGVDHVYRQNENGFRYRAEMYPKINKSLYFHVAYAYADTTLFPQHFALLRMHILLPKRFELALGGRYYSIVDKNLWSYSVWLSKFFGKNWFAIRPTFYSSDSTNTVTYITGIYRYYFNEPNHYIALSLGTGQTPDLLDLDESGFVIIHARHIFASYQMPLTRTFFLSVGAGYMKEDYPKELDRRKWSALIGLKKLF